MVVPEELSVKPISSLLPSSPSEFHVESVRAQSVVEVASQE